MSNVRTAYFGRSINCDLGATAWAAFLTIFTALAVGLPYICHQFGLAGTIFLPIHFAVLTAAMIMGLRGGVIVALVSPILSYSISAMPPAQSLFSMTIELTTYAIVLNVALRKFKMSVIVSLVVSMLAGRIVLTALAALMLRTTPIFSQIQSIFIVGIPGMLIQLALVPMIAAKVTEFLEKR